MKKIAVTWTKWKTTIIRLINFILLELWNKTLSVDSDWVYINWKQKLDKKDSINIYWLLPWKCPWRFLYLGYDYKNKYWKIDYAVLETIIGCYVTWLWYKKHDIWVFSNVFEDHIGGLCSAIKTREDLALRKYRIISKIKTGWYFVYNMDDQLIANNMDDHISNEIKKIWVTKDLEKFQWKKTCIFISKKEVKIKISNKIIKFDLSNNKFSFYWEYEPALYNIGLSIWWLLGLLGEEIFISKHKQIKESIDRYTTDILGGRMILLEQNGRKIILDYAHEKQSLSAVLKLANTLKTGKSIGVVRLSPEREDKIYHNIGKSIASLADEFIVYDKIDWIEDKSYTINTKEIKNKKRNPWEIMHLFAEWIKTKNKKVQEIIYRKDAIKYWLKNTKKGDVIVIIVKNSKETGVFIKKYLKIK